MVWKSRSGSWRGCSATTLPMSSSSSSTIVGVAFSASSLTRSLKNRSLYGHRHRGWESTTDLDHLGWEPLSKWVSRDATHAHLERCGQGAGSSLDSHDEGGPATMTTLRSCRSSRYR